MSNTWIYSDITMFRNIRKKSKSWSEMKPSFCKLLVSPLYNSLVQMGLWIMIYSLGLVIDAETLSFWDERRLPVPGAPVKWIPFSCSLAWIDIFFSTFILLQMGLWSHYSSFSVANPVFLYSSSLTTFC